MATITPVIAKYFIRIKSSAIFIIGLMRLYWYSAIFFFLAWRALIRMIIGPIKISDSENN